MALDAVIQTLITRQPISPKQVENAAQELLKEYIGQNVAINSQQEVDEILLDINTLIAGEEFAEIVF